MCKILIIDDYEESIALIKTFFITSGYTFLSANSGREGLKLAKEHNPDLIILDVIMPGMNGFEVCNELAAGSTTRDIPIIMTTGLEDNKSRSKCFNLGVDYISKPFNIFDIKMRIRKILELQSFKRQLQSAEQLIFKLALIAEAKDSYRAGKSKRLARYGVHFAKHLTLADEQVSSIARGAALHAIGKIEVDEKILTKPGPLTADEFNEVKKYPVAGEKICSSIKSLENVLPIIRSHKEQFDGSGYPDGLKTDSIPFPAQIISLIDRLNALTTDRPYRKAMKIEQAFGVMDEAAEKGKLNPELYREFKKVFKDQDIDSIDIKMDEIL